MILAIPGGFLVGIWGKPFFISLPPEGYIWLVGIGVILIVVGFGLVETGLSPYPSERRKFLSLIFFGYGGELIGQGVKHLLGFPPIHVLLPITGVLLILAGAYFTFKRPM